MAHSLASQETQEADLVIRPAFPAATEFNMHNRVALMAAGDAAVRKALPEIRTLLARYSPALGIQRAAARRWCD